MSTSKFVNYSLRPSKNIQRQLAFAGIRTLMSRLNMTSAMYIGFGSIWFTDFVMAHNILDIDQMISMENNETVFRRAKFNAPYASVSVRKGSSSEVLPTLYDDVELNTIPWVIWLDYDSAFDENAVDDTRTAIERSPTGTILLVTFNGVSWKYGKRSKHRLGRLRDLFGSVVSDDLDLESCDRENVKVTLANLAIDFMKAVAATARRPGGFVPAFRLIYRDSADMVTVGGVLPTSSNMAATARQLVESQDWKSRPDEAIVSPLLTMREAKALQAQLPSSDTLTKELVRTLGFDLEEEQIRVFQRYYKEYPAFAQIVV